MIFLWLIVWLCYGTPQVTTNPINNWFIALIVIAAIDVVFEVLKNGPNR